MQLVREWLEKYEVMEYVSEITAEKPRSQIYIDDKGYHFQNWKDTMNYLDSLNV